MLKLTLGSLKFIFSSTCSLSVRVRLFIDIITSNLCYVKDLVFLLNTHFCKLLVSNYIGNNVLTKLLKY